MDQSNTYGGTASPRRREALVLIKCMGRGGAEGLVVSMMRHRDRDRFDYEVAYVLEDHNTLVPELREAGFAVHSWGPAAIDVGRCASEVESVCDELLAQPTALTR
jgi:hypothetical protein